MYHSYRRGEESFVDNEVLWRKDGTQFAVEYTARPILSDGVPLGSVVVFRDITERIEVEKRLNLLSTALKAAANGIVITNLEGRISFTNPAFTTLTGYSAEEVWDKNPSILKSGKHGDEFYKELWETIQSGQAWSGETINKRKDGSLYTEEMTITPVLSSDGEIVNYVAIKQDITERKRLEAELEKAYERIKGELDIGHSIQMSMVPQQFPAFPDRKDLAIYATLVPAREVGGDFYDFYFLDDDHFCFVVGDVSGKGVPAALFMAVTQTMIKSRSADDYSSASIMTYINNELSKGNDASMFVTVFLGVCDMHTGEITYTNAGHNPPYIKRKDGSVTILDSRHGLVVGAMEDVDYGEDKVTVDPGDMIFVFTDGVTESMNPNQEIFSDEQLETLLNESHFTSGENSVQICMQAVRAFENGAEQADDITIMAMEYFGPELADQPNILNIVAKTELEEIDSVNERIEQFSRNRQVPDSIIGQIRMALDELLNNVISYGYPDENGEILEVATEITPEFVRVIIKDDGIPFNPFTGAEPDTTQSIEDREIGGLGIHLVTNIMDEVDYKREEDKNIVTLVKNLG
jgi:sigma-B regulation protein RsbU (phosphoserine phosphatase)